MQQYYTQQHQSTQGRLAALERSANRVGWLSVGAIFAAALLLGLGVKFHAAPYYLGAAALAALFLTLSKRHSGIQRHQRHDRAALWVLERQMGRYSEAWHAFPEDGGAFSREDHPKSKDLDLLGRRSLYQYLCCAGTGHGKERLAQLLCRNDNPRRGDALGRQEAVRELCGMREFSVELQTRCKEVADSLGKRGEGTLSRFVEEAARDEKPASGLRRGLIWAFPIATVLAVMAALIFPAAPYLQPLAVLLCAIQFFTCLLFLPGHSRSLGTLYSLTRNIAAYRHAFQLVRDQQPFSSELLRELQENLAGTGGAVQALRHLEWIGEAVKIRHNVITCFLCNALFLWDFHCVDLYRHWKRLYGGRLEGWLEAVGELEALLSLASLWDSKERRCFPELLPGDAPAIRCQGLNHPLIVEDKAVPNDFSSGSGVHILTGSNMSGKTTFLRSVGVNLVLAYAGGPVCADHFSAACMPVYTSIRVEDDVSQGISTFYAELLRIKTMVEGCSRQRPMLCLIDEIFRGTNSGDRIACAEQVIRKLAQPWVITLVTTHDFELCALERDPTIAARNHHFVESYRDGTILFDYKIRPGRCRTTNARHLLRLAGVL